MDKTTWIGWVRFGPQRTWRQVVVGPSREYCEERLEIYIDRIWDRNVDSYVAPLGDHPARKGER